MSRLLPQRYDLSWTRGHLAALIVLCAACGALLVIRHTRRPVRAGDRLPMDVQRVEAATEKINPNLADAASLQRLPEIGPVRAAAIVAYRRAHGPQAFRFANDAERSDPAEP